ncbi:MAG: HAD family phosphatase [Bacteroidetes bacterium]|nr:HAD family phosphatase [Bacteroidota bacterium]
MKKIIDRNSAEGLLKDLGGEFAVIRNPAYIHPAFELAPLAPRLTGPLDRLSAAVMDMDGTTTTTEELCIHSLEYMLRAMSGKYTTAEWSGLDHTADYPNIIGNSTTKHVEYLITKYAGLLQTDRTKESFAYAALWTLICGKDAKRKQEVHVTLAKMDLVTMTEDPLFRDAAADPASVPGMRAAIGAELFGRYGGRMRPLSHTDLVTLGIDIYYQRYHEILQRIENGESRQISMELFHDPEKRLIQPMPGILFFLPLLKGWLGDEAALFADRLFEEYATKSGHEFPASERHSAASSLASLGRFFEQHPAKLAIVTSSIFYEANIVMSEVFSVLSAQLASVPLSAGRQTLLRAKLQQYRNVYDAFITASDSTEIRLKPHRDLYSIALHQLNIPTADFHRVIGFEDSESGTIAIRTAGIGRCIAVPFAQTKGHNFDAATLVALGGIPEVVLSHNVFLNA